MKFSSKYDTLKKDSLYHDLWLVLLNTLEQHNKAVYSTSDQKKYVQTLDSLIFILWNELQKLDDKEYINQLKEFINSYGLAFFQTITDYLRKELKVPKYSEMYDDKEQLYKETEILFSKSEKLEEKLEQIKSIVNRVQEVIKQNEDVHVSFGVYESLNQLASAPVREFRLLDCLKI